LGVLEHAIGLLRAAGSASRNYSIQAALAALEAGQPGRARQLWERSRGKKIDGYAMAELLIRLGEEASAQKALDRLSPTTTAQHAQKAYLQAMLAAQQGNLAEAASACVRAREQDALHVPACFLLLEVYVKMGEKRKARRLAQSLKAEESLGTLVQAKLQNYLP
jgi:thioredoxin-like negative regulator of GroEL